ncbi:MAG: hypothetical protein DWQ04_18800 [Chloroflexi bacterium]|nr:MAG: hypothetical protein DWQ04_18800 [Chloroflexota bacterium]
MKTTISFSLDTERDHDILQWLNSLPDGGRSKAIREALRANLGEQEVTLADVYQAIMDLKRGGLTVSGSSSVDQAVDDEPPDIAHNLDNLGL